ncbi:MAG: hypothetical protein R6W69_16805, partial [Anaerolineales bacterium]
ACANPHTAPNRHPLADQYPAALINRLAAGRTGQDNRGGKTHFGVGRGIHPAQCSAQLPKVIHD